MIYPYNLNKKSFSLIELIFMIVVIGIIAAVAVPKLMSTRSNAIISTLKQDIATITTSIQSYYLLNGRIDKISDTVVINNSTWTTISDNEIKYIEGSNDCVDIVVINGKLNIIVDKTAGIICNKLFDSGAVTVHYDLN
jgi:general secretion pathway protein G